MAEIYKTQAKKLGNYLDTITNIKKSDKKSGIKLHITRQEKKINIYIKDWKKKFVGIWDLSRNLIKKTNWEIKPSKIVMYLVGELIKKEVKP